MRKMTITILIILVLALFMSLQFPANLHAQAGGCAVLWNKLGSKTEVENSEVGPGIQQRSYIYSDWDQAQIVPAQFGNGLFINHDTNEGWSNDGANFFAVDLEGTGLTPYRGAIEFWFKFKYDSSVHNHAFFIHESIVLTGHYLPGQIRHENVQMYIGWNGWDYGSYGKRFFFGINHYPNLGEVIALTPDYSAAPGGHLEFNDGTMFHFAFVWDVEGIENTQDTLRIYVNGNKEASATGKWVTDGGLDRYLYLGTIPNYDPHQTYYNAVKGVTDNIIIWDYARTDFSHRFDETPPIPPECQQEILNYISIMPCRIVDTRKAGGALTPGEIRSYYVHGFLAYQGGNPAGCQSPKGEPRAVHVNVTSVPLGNGWITAYPFGSTAPTASLVNYRSDAQNVANSGTVKTCFGCGKDINIKSVGGKTHVIIDVLGYYYKKP